MSLLYVVIRIDDRLAAIPAGHVESVIELEDIYPVPRAPAHVAGLAAMRSQSLTVIDCRAALGLPQSETCGERAPVVSVDGHLYALRVDLVDDVLESRSEMQPVPGDYGPGWQRVGRGMIESESGPLLILDVEALVAGLQKQAA